MNEQKPIEKIQFNDPKVIDFLRYLGVNPILNQRVTITVEPFQFVEVEETRHAIKPAE